MEYDIQWRNHRISTNVLVLSGNLPVSLDHDRSAEQCYNWLTEEHNYSTASGRGQWLGARMSV